MMFENWILVIFFGLFVVSDLSSDVSRPWPWSIIIWVANDKDSKLEAVLDYIVERKRLDDLSKSIIDGRYNEQKVS